jgi:hypothetical protein
MMSSMRTVLATAFPLFLGCGLLLGCGADGVGGDEATMAGLPAAFSGPGTYTVPADPTVLFPITKVDVEQAGGSVSVYYELPTEFAAQTHVDLTGPADGTATVHLSGDAGTSTCTIAAGALSCHEDLSGVQFDSAKAMSALPPGDPRAAAVDAFISEPIGVLTLQLPASPSTE